MAENSWTKTSGGMKMAKYAKQIHENDNVATAVADIRGEEKVTVRFKGEEYNYSCKQDVSFGHKIAIADIAKGEKIVKYGQPIGTASQDISKGEWVHVHNVKDDYRVLDKEGNPYPGQD
jgi:altronate dehydratase small subunit